MYETDGAGDGRRSPAALWTAAIAVLLVLGIAVWVWLSPSPTAEADREPPVRDTVPRDTYPGDFIPAPEDASRPRTDYSAAPGLHAARSLRA